MGDWKKWRNLVKMTGEKNGGKQQSGSIKTGTEKGTLALYSGFCRQVNEQKPFELRKRAKQ